MFARSTDTDPEAERVQIELLRRASVGQRLRLSFSLSQTVIGLARRAIARSLGDASEEQIGLRFVELHYGPDLAAAVRRYLAERRG